MQELKSWSKIGAAGLLVASLTAGAGGQQKYQQVPVSNGGAIKGTVVWTGAPAEPVKFQVTTDGKTCVHQTQGTKASPRLVVGTDGGSATQWFRW